MSVPANPKILYIVSQLGQGGAEQQLYYLLKYLKPDATVLSLAPGGYWLKPFQELGYKVVELQRSGSFDLSRLQNVMRVIREERPDVVHLWMDGVPGAYGRLSTLLLRFRPTIVGIRSHPERDPSWYSRLTRLWLNRYITLFVSNAVSSQEYMVQHDQVPAPRSRFIPNGIELFRFSPREDASARALLPEDWRDKVIVGSVGALAHRKAPDVLVRVARAVIDQNPDVRFVHAGDGPLRESIHQMVRELGVDSHILFLGSRSDVPDVLRSLDILLMTSSNEGTPNAVMEAMATALPCVVTDTGDCKTVVQHGETGFVAPVGDVNCLAEYTVKLANDPHLRTQMGRAGYERVQSYRVQEMAKQYQALYQDALAAK
jgi:glycosyltransferase involved in cell wall biosynthesis